MKTKPLIAAGIAALLAGSLPARAEVVTLDAIDFGWYDDDGSHATGNTNTLAGRIGRTLYRNWFAFDLGSIKGRIENARLKLGALAIGGTDTASWNAWDYGGRVDDLLGGTAGTGGFDDLGGGRRYGIADLLRQRDRRGDQIVDLNENALSDLRGTRGTFVVGGSLQVEPSGGGDAWVRWDGEFRNSPHQLIVETVPVPTVTLPPQVTLPPVVTAPPLIQPVVHQVPEPAAIGLLAAGAVGALLPKRRRRAAA